MEVKDLRIGNFIQDDDGALGKIIGFKPFDHSCRCDELEGCEILIDIYTITSEIKTDYYCDSNLCEPIPLTEDWLLKAGFEKRQWASSNVYQCNIFGIEQRNKGWYLIDHDFNNLRHFEYIHQLQNIYYYLTGEELQFDLSHTVK